MSILALIAQAVVVAVIIVLIVYDLRQPTAPVADRTDDPDWGTLHILANEETPAERAERYDGGR